MSNEEKFTDKVADYVRYRPSYPRELIDYLVNEVGFTQDAVVADVGAGTGIFTRFLAGTVGRIFAVEPNLNMRTACVEYCAGIGSITVVGGSAEATNLPDQSLDSIAVAQAFHWFDRQKTKVEFKRILKSEGKVVLVWNTRVPESQLTKENYELCRLYCPEFKGFSGGRDIDPKAYGDFFKDGHCDYRVFDHDLFFDMEGFIGYNLSTSFAPVENDTKYKPFVDGLKRVFEKYSDGVILRMPNETHCYMGGI